MGLDSKNQCQMEGAFPCVGVVLSLRKKKGLFDHIDVWHKNFFCLCTLVATN